MTNTIKKNFFTKYFLTLIISGHFLISSYAMTHGFQVNLFIHFFLTFMLTFVTLFIEILANRKLNLKDKAIKITPLVVLNALFTFAICVAFVYV